MRLAVQKLGVWILVISTAWLALPVGALAQTESEASQPIVEAQDSPPPVPQEKPTIEFQPAEAPALTVENGLLIPKRNIVQFDRDIAPIFKENCHSCHHGESPKGGFSIEEKEALLGYLEAGDSQNSSLWTDYLTQPSREHAPESLVMPPDGPLSSHQLALIKLWIEEGAEWSDASAAAASASVPTTDPGFAGRLYKAIGYFHPAVVHFPIALFVLSGACAFLSYFVGPRCESMAFHCLWIAVLGTLASVVMGWSFADQRGMPAWNQWPSETASHAEMTFFFHRWLGVSLLVLSVIIMVIGMVSAKSRGVASRNTWKVGAMLLALLVSIVGHQGGELVYGEIFDKAFEQLTK